MTYKLTNSTLILRVTDGAYIPADPANRDYAEYLAWVAAGNQPDPQFTNAELLTNAKRNKTNELSAACRSQIYAGFTSSALGSAHTYPANDKDQANLSASVVASLLPNLPATWVTQFWCMDAAGVWSFANHTAAQIQQVGADGKVAVLSAMQKNAQLAAQVEAAATVADVQAITWPTV